MDLKSVPSILTASSNESRMLILDRVDEVLKGDLTGIFSSANPSQQTLVILRAHLC